MEGLAFLIFGALVLVLAVGIAAGLYAPTALAVLGWLAAIVAGAQLARVAIHKFMQTFELGRFNPENRPPAPTASVPELAGALS